MPTCHFLFRWNGLTETKKLYVLGIKHDSNDRWRRRQKPKATFKYKRQNDGEYTTVSLECDCIAIENKLIISVTHNDSTMASIIVSRDSAGLTARVGNFSEYGEFVENCYGEEEMREQVSFVWGVDEYPEDLFSRCYENGFENQ